ncbi:MAG: MFS transporter [Candidatus Dormibacteraeota bacterium]|uniref:MFS transporter n=1 Tax=Candidatus Dormiibacter inghamiae TaxID=3127013 RepID=A0A934KFK1_9BACT|nr:MFS transporter [Candidatus Dormibacteraeota bacterium]MBJ7605773.1 MFS transporter [Candidatus Dormibacteraeota bacterium]
MLSDVRRIAAIQGIRAFAYGFTAVLLGVVLAREGFSAAQVGEVFAAMLAGMGLMTLVVAVTGDRLGRRRVYLALLVGLLVAGVVFALTTSHLLLILAALTGTLSTDANESGPISSLEQAMLGQAPARERTRVFSRYNAVAFLFGSLGALAAGGPALLRHLIPAVPANRSLLLVLPVAGLVCALLALRLGPGVDAPKSPETRPGLGTARPRILGLAFLFGVDSLASGFVVQAFLVYWFSRRFGASTEVMGLVFFSTGVLQAASSVASGWLSVRIGMLPTMVFSHLPANLLLAAIALAPTLTVAVPMLLVRSFLSSMDVPARQAFTASIVRPEQRASAAATTNVTRYFVKPLGPLIGGALMQVAFGAPLVAAAALKIAYDLALFTAFRNLEPEREAGGPAQAAARSDS